MTDSDRQHWSFQPVRRPTVPKVTNRQWVRSPIDTFILSRLEERGWKPAAAAPPAALLRRLTFDVTGLPPTPDELDRLPAEFIADDYEQLVDELLARPGYGERWGRHWLDLVRYAETNGYERDGAKPHVWRYRDYVIDSLNADKPYDRFLTEQLAGDELPDASSETVIALGYHRLGPWDDEPADPAEDRFDQLDDIVSTTAQVFLGLTLGCARCHDHKFEPLTALDYYRMTAIFNPLRRFQNGRSDLDAPAGSASQLAAQSERDRQIARHQAQIDTARDAVRGQLLASGGTGLPPDAVAAFQARAEARSEPQKKLVEQHAAALDAAIDRELSIEAKRQLDAAAEAIRALRRETPDLPRAYFLHEPGPTPPTTHLLLRGKATRPGIVAEPGAPVVLAAQPLVFPPSSSATSQRRLTLARWLASPDNPLTARVIVNRVWQFHFGEGLVRTPSDFGVMGAPPTHPELLDYLAAEFMAHGWSLKWLHREILCSQTYRMEKAWRDDYGAADPENRLFWRVPYRRLEVEAIRDAMLVVSGRLDSRQGGAPVFPFIPREALAANSDPDKVWPPYNEQAASRRTVYAFIKRALVVPMIEVLDLCDTTRSSAKRGVTSVAPQALTLFNGQFVNEQARHFALRLEREGGQDWVEQGERAGAVAISERAYRLALGRPPTAAEQRSAVGFLDLESARLQRESPEPDRESPPAARRAALAQFCRVVFNLNEFVYTD
ncbi:MAG: DUF1553 domain-containing protein [Planctomycetales bacterium]